MKGLYILSEDSFAKIYGEAEQQDIQQLVDIYAPPQTTGSIKENPEILRDVELVFSGWGGPRVDEDFLQAAPHLKAVFYGAGSIKGIVSEAFWKQGITITSAYGANAVPVAEYTLSQILFCLKHGWHYALSIKREGKYIKKAEVPGAYATTVGLISLGMIGRLVAELLKPFDMEVIAYDPFVAAGEAEELGVKLCSLDELFRRSDVASLHTPWLKETEGMITGEHFRLMKPGAAFINTARGAIVQEEEMIEVLTQRKDVTAVLDVTYPEPPKPGSPLYTLPNVVLTPHIAGSMDGECRRMGRYMVDELKRYLAGQPLEYGIDEEKSKTLA